MPAPPDYEWMRAPDTHRYVSKTYEACNYLQALEGGLDTAHSSYLHNMKLGDTNRSCASATARRGSTSMRTDYGYYYVSTRKAGEDGHYVRLYHYVLPYQQMRGGLRGIGRGNDVPKLDGHLWVPIDDEQTNVYNWGYSADPAVSISAEMSEAFEHSSGRGKDDLIPGTFKLKRNLSNDYLIDRRAAEDPDLHRHRRHQHAGFRAPGRDGADRRPQRGISGLDRPRDRHAEERAARGDDCGGKGRARARHRSRDPSRRPAL